MTAPRAMPPKRPEILAPAGDPESLAAALAAGANAVYLGLDDGFNARARATNFSLDNLGRIAAQVHRAGARLYVTLNTLLFESELPVIERILRGVAAAGVDAVLVQDPAVALLAQRICPDLELHASTQMTVSSPEAARFAQALGIRRVVVPRELSVHEIERFAADSPVELEAFIHGALCVSWSGQCLSSESWGGRSANRGQCAQACRMPYDLVVDGETRPTGELRYLLSPKDLSGMRAVPRLAELGISSLKIEGRLKGPAYVMTAVGGLARRLDAALDGRAEAPDEVALMSRDLAAMQVTYSRGFGDGFLAGSDHQTLVDGRFPKHRGLFLGRVAEVRGKDVRTVNEPAFVDRGRGELASPLPAFGGSETAAAGARVAPPEPRPGMGIVFDGGHPEDEDEPGGPLFGAEPTADGWMLRFGNPGPDPARIGVGDRVWITSDPAIRKEADKLVRSGPPSGRNPMRLRVSGSSGASLRITASCGRHQVTVDSGSPLQPARGAGLDEALLRDKLGALGGTAFHLVELDSSALSAGLHLPVKELKALRRALVDQLTPPVERGPERSVVQEDQAPALRTELAAALAPTRALLDEPRIVPLCRTPEQLDAIIEAGVREVELDWMEMTGLRTAALRARAAGLQVTIATVRVQKPEEQGYDKRIERLEPDAVLVRHWGGLVHFAELAPGERPVLHGDFSLNVTNSITALHLLGLGLDTVTAAHDLDAVQLARLLDRVPAERVAVTVHHHMPTFHTEHCVYAHMLSDGRDYRSCGRPCEAHRVGLRDHLSREHPVIVDVACRNTVFDARAQSAAHLLSKLTQSGVRRLRVEFVWETAEQTRDVLDGYRDLLHDRIDHRELLERVGVHEQFGVTRGTMQVLR